MLSYSPFFHALQPTCPIRYALLGWWAWHHYPISEGVTYMKADFCTNQWCTYGRPSKDMTSVMTCKYTASDFSKLVSVWIYMILILYSITWTIRLSSIQLNGGGLYWFVSLCLGSIICWRRPDNWCSVWLTVLEQTMRSGNQWRCRWCWNWWIPSVCRVPSQIRCWFTHPSAFVIHINYIQ